MKAYCDCTWTEFRKRFSAAELGDEGTVASERFVAARAPVVKACSNKMPESVSKDAFMKGCAKDQAADKFCGCAWKELRKQASPAEIESGTFDQKTIFGAGREELREAPPAEAEAEAVAERRGPGGSGVRAPPPRGCNKSRMGR